MKFLIVQSPSPYNVLLGRPTICRLRAVVSTMHAMMKFPTSSGIATLRAERKKVQECLLLDEGSRLTKALQQGPQDVAQALLKVPLVINDRFPEQPVGIGTSLSPTTKVRLEKLLRANIDVFAWKYSDMTGVPRHIAEHRLNIHKSVEPIVQKKRSLAPDRSKAVTDEVEELVRAGIMREVRYRTWVANPVLGRKSDESWRMCVDFKDVNNACPKDAYPLPEVDLKVESLMGFKYKCFLDAYKGYHQIQMALADEDKTAFHTDKGIFCYRKMPFGLKNAGATYQRLVDAAFSTQIGRNLEAYVDDIVIKSKMEDTLLADIEETFNNLRKINMKLNPKKCSFGVTEGKFLGHIILEKGIKANPEKVAAIINMPRPKTVKEVQSLNGKLAAMSRYLSSSASKSLPFFKTLKNCLSKKDFKWTTEAENAFTELKVHLASLPMLTTPIIGEELYIYLAATDRAVSSVLMAERGKVQTPIYFVSRVLHGPEETKLRSKI